VYTGYCAYELKDTVFRAHIKEEDSNSDLHQLLMLELPKQLQPLSTTSRALTHTVHQRLTPWYTLIVRARCCDRSLCSACAL
jgi:hypothetical protein